MRSGAHTGLGAGFGRAVTDARGVGRGGWRVGPGRALIAAASVALTLMLVVGSSPTLGRPVSGTVGGHNAGNTSGNTSAKRPATATSRSAPSSAPVRLGPTDPSRPITITLTLIGQSQAALAGTIAAINDPHSPEYRHYLTPDEYTRRFGAPAAATARVESALAAAGFSVASPPAGGILLHASGTVGEVEALFGVTLDDYRDADGTVYYEAESGPHLPAAFGGAVAGVLGLDSRPMIHRAGITKLQKGAQGHPPPHPLGPTEVKTAYNITPLADAGLNGSGQTMAFAEIDTFRQSDIDAYDAIFNINGASQVTSPVEVVTVDGGATPAKDVSETTLDIEVVHAVAPATHLIAYEGAADFRGLTDTFAKIVNDDRAQVMSISLGGCETAIAQDSSLGQPYLNTLTQIFQQAATQGMTVLVASGDNGAYTCKADNPNDTSPSVSLPADNPWVTSVGGTALFVNGTGTGATYNSEAGWEGPLEGSGGGGGVSMAYPIPSWQNGPGVSNQYSDGSRQLPDVSASADPMTGYVIYDTTAGPCTAPSADQCLEAVGGTSAAAPLWGALVALANQQAASSGKKTVGFINPALYAMGRGEMGASPFHDVTSGGNLYYQASPGWDYSTGWGSPDAAAVVKDLVSQAPAK